MKQRHTIILAVFALGLSCTAAKRGTVIAEPGPATQPTAINGNMLSSSSPDGPGTVSGKQHSEYWTINYEVSGGFAGIRRQLNVSNDGSFVASDLKRKRRVEQQASPEQIVKIADALSKIDFAQLPAMEPKLSSRCADCFHHKLTVTKDDQPHKLNFDDTTLKDPACAALIGLLSTMLNQALVQQGP